MNGSIGIVLYNLLWGIFLGPYTIKYFLPHASPVSKLSGKTDIKMPHFQIIGKDNYRESVKLYFSIHQAISMTEEFLVLLQNKKKKERGRRL